MHAVTGRRQKPGTLGQATDGDKTDWRGLSLKVGVWAERPPASNGERLGPAQVTRSPVPTLPCHGDMTWVTQPIA